MKHTQGNWIVDVTDRAIAQYPGFYAVKSEKGKLIALMPLNAEDESGEWEANLKIVAMVPRLVEKIKIHNEIIKQAREVFLGRGLDSIVEALDEVIHIDDEMIESIS